GTEASHSSDGSTLKLALMGWFPSCNDNLLIFFDGFRAYFRRPFSSVASLLNHESKSCKALRLHRKTSDQTVSYIAFIPVSPSGFFFVVICPTAGGCPRDAGG
ncbi:hypothetical protein, partial [Escherichia coli]|uniref:hypothetical protein n=1 Tax=Escherichia coli TaxID=562 RepID=UPI001BC834B1